MLLMRVSGKVGGAGGGEISARVGLAEGSGNKGTLGVCHSEWCVSLERLYDVSDI